MLAAIAVVCAAISYEHGIYILVAGFSLVALLLLFDTLRYRNDRDLK